MFISNILIIISSFSVLLPVFFFVRKKQNFKNTIIRVLGILLAVSALSDLTSSILNNMHKSYRIVSNNYFIIQILLLSYTYYHLLKHKKTISIITFLFIIFCICYALFIQSFNEFQSWSHTIGHIIMIGYALGYYIHLLKYTPETSLFRYYPFWINTAVFFYFGATVLIFASRNYIFTTQTVEFSHIIWSFHNVINIIKNILFAIAIYWAGINQKEENVKLL